MADWEPYVTWDNAGEHIFETGVDHGMLFVCDKDGKYQTGVPWSGLISVHEKNDGGDAANFYSDDIKYMQVKRNENVSLTIKAFTYPIEFGPCIGEYELINGFYIGQQAHRRFGITYRSKIGNDTQGTDFKYKLHLIYGCLAQPAEREFKTINQNPDATEFSWSVDCDGMRLSGYKPIAEIVVDTYRIAKPLIDASTITDVTTFDVYSAAKVSTLEQKLYGTAATYADDGTKLTDAILPVLPTPYDILSMFQDYCTYVDSTVDADDPDYEDDMDDDDPDDYDDSDDPDET